MLEAPPSGLLKQITSGVAPNNIFKFNFKLLVTIKKNITKQNNTMTI